MKDKKILLLAGEGLSTNIVFNAIEKNFGVDAVIIETKGSRINLVKTRARRLGFFIVLGQLLFQVLVAKPLAILSRKRQQEIIEDFSLDTSEIPFTKIKQVENVNSEETIDLINKVAPDLIVVNGTRIISRRVLESVSCNLINAHVGITPKYRGVHGGYWALYNGDAENFGVTIHFIDPGIDTGSIIGQAFIQPSPKDNFATYPILQLAAGIPILLQAIKDNFNGPLQTKTSTSDSKLWYHPTLRQYLYGRFFKKVK